MPSVHQSASNMELILVSRRVNHNPPQIRLHESGVEEDHNRHDEVSQRLIRRICCVVTDCRDGGYEEAE